MKTGQWIALAALGVGVGYLMFRARSASASTGTDQLEQEYVEVPVGGVSLGPMPKEPLESGMVLRDMVLRSDSRANLPTKGEYDLREVVRPGPRPRMQIGMRIG